MHGLHSKSGAWIHVAVLSVSGVLLVGSSCTLPYPETPPGPPPETPEHCATCCDARWIGRLAEAPSTHPPLPEERGGSEQTGRYDREPEEPETDCPSGWKPVFTSSARPPKPVPPGLRRFCVSEHEPRRPYREFETIERDCRIVGPAAETFFKPGEYGAELGARFRREALGDPPQPVLPAAGGLVRLVIVDSVQDGPDDAGDPGSRKCRPAPQTGDLECSLHGEVLVELAKDLLCTGAGCAAEITTRRVLRGTHVIQPVGSSPTAVELEYTDAEGEVQGGFSGFTEDLATAIWRAVEPWWAEGGGRPGLILNLSVGWEPHHKPDSPLVRAAIQDAVCRGALVIAAAGNRVAGPSSWNRPLLPAAWEQEPAPTAAECQTLLEGSASPQPAPAGYAPLLYAVGGVQRDGRRLSNARPNAMPPRVAFGDHASVVYPGPEPRHETLTGTSVSTLVVSAAAAYHWRKHEELASFEVMEELQEEGTVGDHPQSVDFALDTEALGSPPQIAKRIYVHGKPPTVEQSWPEGMPPVDDVAINQALQTGKAFGDMATAVELPGCVPRHLDSMVDLPAGAELCPQRLVDVATRPALGPQPGANHNPDCGFLISSPGKLLLEFDPRYRIEGLPATLSDFTLLMQGKAYRLSNEELLLGEPWTDRHQIVVSDIPIEDPYPLYLATTVNGSYATITPILLMRSGDP